MSAGKTRFTDSGIKKAWLAHIEPDHTSSGYIMPHYPRKYRDDMLDRGCPLDLLEEIDKEYCGLWDEMLVRMLEVFTYRRAGHEVDIRRRKTHLNRRLKPCIVCDYPISQFHHLLPVAIWGNNPNGIHLCPNCHDAYHFINSHLSGKNDKALKLAQTFIVQFPLRGWYILYFNALVSDVYRAFRQYEKSLNE